MSQQTVISFTASDERRAELDRAVEQCDEFDSRSDAAREMVSRGVRDWRAEQIEYPGHQMITEGTRLSALVSILSAVLAAGGAVTVESVALAGSAMLVFLVAHLTGQWLAASGRL